MEVIMWRRVLTRLGVPKGLTRQQQLSCQEKSVCERPHPLRGAQDLVWHDRGNAGCARRLCRRLQRARQHQGLGMNGHAPACAFLEAPPRGTRPQQQHGPKATAETQPSQPAIWRSRAPASGRWPPFLDTHKKCVAAMRAVVVAIGARRARRRHGVWEDRHFITTP